MNPGFISQSQAEQLNALADLTSSDKARLDGVQRPSRDVFPARLTGYDPVRGAYSWVEQWYDASGARVDFPNGRSGTSSFAPAKAIGTGSYVTSFPTEVVLRRVIDSESVGPVYEFPWYCACGSSYYSGSGSGSGSSGGVSLCGCSGLPTTLYATITATGAICSALNGVVITLTYNGTDTYSGSYSAGGRTFQIAFSCVVGGPSWLITYRYLPSPCPFINTASTPVAGCSPFSVTFTNIPHDTTCCPGTIDIVISV